jgi:hypothetical protein
MGMGWGLESSSNVHGRMFQMEERKRERDRDRKTEGWSCSWLNVVWDIELVNNALLLAPFPWPRPER